MRDSIHRARAAAVALFAVAALSFAAGPCAASDAIDITIDFAKILRLTQPAGTIVIGNPGIADATVGGNKTVVLTGKAAGTTNMIILDDKGQEIINTTVRVASNVRQLTTIYYGNKRETYACAPTCEHIISVGDAKESFENARTQIQGRQEFAGTGK